jgi:hypothetical protein
MRVAEAIGVSADWNPKNHRESEGGPSLRARATVAILTTVFGLVLLFGNQVSQAQSTAPGGRLAVPEVPTNPPASILVNPPPRDGVGSVAIQRITTRLEFWLSLVVLVFGFVVVMVEYRLLQVRAFTSDEVLRVFTVTLIVVGTLFALTAGFDSQQIAPAMGLFGTIAGYLLGRRYPARQSLPRAAEKGSGI